MDKTVDISDILLSAGLIAAILLAVIIMIAVIVEIGALRDSHRCPKCSVRPGQRHTASCPTGKVGRWHVGLTV